MSRRDDPLSVPFSASYDVPLATAYVPAPLHQPLPTPQLHGSTQRRTGLDVHRPHVRVHDLRRAAAEVERVPDVARGPEEVRPPAVAHVDRAAPQREVERVLRVPRARRARRDVLLRGPRARERLRARLSVPRLCIWAKGGRRERTHGGGEPLVRVGRPAARVRRDQEVFLHAGKGQQCRWCARGERGRTPLRFTMPGASSVAPVRAAA